MAGDNQKGLLEQIYTQLDDENPLLFNVEGKLRGLKHGPNTDPNVIERIFSRLWGATASAFSLTGSSPTFQRVVDSSKKAPISFHPLIDNSPLSRVTAAKNKYKVKENEGETLNDNIPPLSRLQTWQFIRRNRQANNIGFGDNHQDHPLKRAAFFILRIPSNIDYAIHLGIKVLKEFVRMIAVVLILPHFLLAKEAYSNKSRPLRYLAALGAIITAPLAVGALLAKSLTTIALNTISLSSSAVTSLLYLPSTLTHSAVRYAKAKKKNPVLYGIAGFFAGATLLAGLGTLIALTIPALPFSLIGAETVTASVIAGMAGTAIAAGTVAEQTELQALIKTKEAEKEGEQPNTSAQEKITLTKREKAEIQRKRLNPAVKSIDRQTQEKTPLVTPEHSKTVIGPGANLYYTYFRRKGEESDLSRVRKRACGLPIPFMTRKPKERNSLKHG